jgi:hypothetical protein
MGQAHKTPMSFEYTFVKAGGMLLAALDPTGNGRVVAGFGDQREVELLVEAGFTPIEAAPIATPERFLSICYRNLRSGRGDFLLSAQSEDDPVGVIVSE